MKKFKSTLVGNLDTFYLRNNNFRQDQDRAIRVWKPVDYSEDGEKFDVIYMLDGNNLFDCQTASYHMEWCIDETFTYFYQNYRTRCPVVVGIDCGKDRMNEYLPPFFTESEVEEIRKIYKPEASRDQRELPFTQLGEETFRYLFDDVMPYIEEKYNVRSDRDGRYFGGSSMGGLMSIYAYQHYNEYFSKYIAFSIAFNMLSFASKSDDAYNKFKDEFKFYDNSKIAICCGGVDFEKDFEPYYFDFVKFLKDKGFDDSNLFTTHNPKELHNELQWARAFNPAMRFFLNMNKETN